MTPEEITPTVTRRLTDQERREAYGELTVGQRILAAREAAGLSQRQLGEVVGVDRIHVIAWEKGRRRPVREYRIKLANALEVPLAYLRHDGPGGKP